MDTKRGKWAGGQGVGGGGAVVGLKKKKRKMVLLGRSISVLYSKLYICFISFTFEHL